MRSLFDDIGIEYIREGIQHLRDKADYETRIKAYGKRENFYYGGTDRNLQYLVRHPNEDDIHWVERKGRFAHWGYTGRIGHAFISAICSGEIKREIVGATDAQMDWFLQIYDLARWEAYQRQVYQGQIVLGDAFACPGYSGDLRRVRILTPHAEKIAVEKHPDDPLIEISVAEERVNPNNPDKPWYWVWTKERYILIDSDSSPVEWDDGTGRIMRGWIDNPYGVIPYAHVRGKTMLNEYWGCSLLDDVIELNQLINNEASNVDRIVLYQGHSQPVIKGDLLNATVKGGPTEAIGVQDNGDFFYATPNADIAGCVGWLVQLVDRLFEIGGIPSSIVRGGSASSGYQLEVECRTMQQIIADAIVEATMFERELARLVCIVNNVHRTEIDGSVQLPDEPDVVVQFTPNLIPRDKAADREQDRQDVRDGVLTKREYVSRWVMPDADEKVLNDYMVKLAEEKPKEQNPLLTEGKGFGGLL